LAGAYYGENGIPKAWREKLAFLPMIESLAGRLFEMSRLK
jgi:ADP-ribosylglycohydrolase